MRWPIMTCAFCAFQRFGDLMLTIDALIDSYPALITVCTQLASSIISPDCLFFNVCLTSYRQRSHGKSHQSSPTLPHSFASIYTGRDIVRLIVYISC